MKSKLIELVDLVVKIREFEKKIQEVYQYDLIQSPVHLSIGQELASALISINMDEKDKVVGNYRSHGIAVALSESTEEIVLELMAKEQGISAGRAGSMHLSVPYKGLMWTSAIVGTGVPIACGIAEALKRGKDGAICTVMFGDGAIEEGGVLEAINLSQTRNLPLVFVLEDNGLAIHTKKKDRSSVKEYCEIAKAYGVKHWKLTYKQPIEMVKAFEEAYSYCRKKQEPVFIEIKCFRWTEHVGVGFDWKLGYRSESEINEWKTVDILENPSIIDIEKSYVLKKMAEYQDYYGKLFNKCKEMEDAKVENITKNT